VAAAEEAEAEEAEVEEVVAAVGVAVEEVVEVGAVVVTTSSMCRSQTTHRTLAGK
jgi:hypothetical protein